MTGTDLLAQRLRDLRRLPTPAERRAIRLRAGAPVSWVAEAVGCSRQAVSLWEAGRRNPTGSFLAAYLDALDVMQSVGAAQTGTI